MAARLIVKRGQINGVAQLAHQFRFRFDFTARWTVHCNGFTSAVCKLVNEFVCVCDFYMFRYFHSFAITRRDYK